MISKSFCFIRVPTSLELGLYIDTHEGAINKKALNHTVLFLIDGTKIVSISTIIYK